MCGSQTTSTTLSACHDAGVTAVHMPPALAPGWVGHLAPYSGVETEVVLSYSASTRDGQDLAEEVLHAMITG